MKGLISEYKIKQIMHRSMTRREFLIYLGIFFFSIIGGVAFLKNLFKSFDEVPAYGNNGYGGKKKGDY